MRNKIQFSTCVVVITALLFSILLFGQQKAHRIVGSPFPASSIPEHLFFIKDAYYTQ